MGVQTEIDTFVNHFGAKVAGCPFGDTPLKDQFNAVRSANVQIVTNNGFKPLASTRRVIEDLRVTELDLPDGQAMHSISKITCSFSISSAFVMAGSYLGQATSCLSIKQLHQTPPTWRFEAKPGYW